jgi:TM2 domain-containing membrane protein YozV
MQTSFERNTHNRFVGYVLWIFGFTGAHRFYFGKPITGTLWFFTLGLLGVGWLIDAFLIPGMDRAADHRYVPGRYDYSLAWVLLTFGGYLGLHRMYIGKWGTGLLYLCTLGLCGVGWVYDFWTWNGQISDQHRSESFAFA